MLPGVWNQRTRLILVWAQWIALALAIFASFAAEQGVTPLVLGAAGMGGTFVLGSTMTPLAWLKKPLVLDGAVMSGVILTMIAVTLTGSANSPYLLLAITPTLWAGFFGGVRTAFSAALLASGLLLLVELSDETVDVPGVLLVAGIQLLIAITISQVRRLLGEIQTRNTQMEDQQQVAARRIRELENAHDLLGRLAEVTAGQDVNPMSLATAALDDLVDLHPGMAAAAAIDSTRGPVLVARAGIEPPNPTRNTLPLIAGGRETGWVMIATPHPVSKGELGTISETLTPLALAFSNILMLQSIAARAINEERVRIARDLHDDLGPSLASLGLALDMTLINHPLEGPVADQITHLRRSVSYLVDDIRKTVADLRAEPEPSLVNLLKEIAAEVGDRPGISIELDERRPPRPSVAHELAAIANEAIRNAVNHSGASRITVSGMVDFDRGWASIHDNGVGFDPGSVRDGHYGLLGMKERARKIGGGLKIRSDGDGTDVSVEWGPR
ncbi:MAG: sensor histidine kinase [Acidimicrobiia bacterium]